jgi:hypothetical protein
MIQGNKDALHVNAVQLELLVEFEEERLDGPLADVDARLEEQEM